MNGFVDHRLDEAAFGEKKGLTGGLSTFDAFPKTKPSYTRRSSFGGYTTSLLLLLSAFLSFTEVRRWYRGYETQLFSVKKGVSHDLQINLDIVVPMACADLHVNVQDASGDRILAGDLLRKEATAWRHWVSARGIHYLDRPGIGHEQELERDTHAAHVLGEAGGLGMKKRKFRKTPRGPGPRQDCRIFGSLEGNKVQGDFHITARGHGYMEFGEHLDHSAFNFSHIINELSFGPFYPSLLNPLSKTFSTTSSNFYKYQYYLSLVPTIYTRLPPSAADSTLASSSLHASKDTIHTNQYAVTSHATAVSERAVPGIFFKFDIEPILLTVREEREGVLRLLVRVLNAVSGVLVGGGWCYQLLGWSRELLGGKHARAKTDGVLHGRGEKHDDGD